MCAWRSGSIEAEKLCMNGYFKEYTTLRNIQPARAAQSVEIDYNVRDSAGAILAVSVLADSSDVPNGEHRKRIRTVQLRNDICQRVDAFRIAIVRNQQ